MDKIPFVDGYRSLCTYKHWFLKQKLFRKAPSREHYTAQECTILRYIDLSWFSKYGQTPVDGGWDSGGYLYPPCLRLSAFSLRMRKPRTAASVTDAGAGGFGGLVVEKSCPKLRPLIFSLWYKPWRCPQLIDTWGGSLNAHRTKLTPVARALHITPRVLRLLYWKMLPANLGKVKRQREFHRTSTCLPKFERWINPWGTASARWKVHGGIAANKSR